MAGEPKIGALLKNKHAERDAIHIAVAPVTATEELRPGQHIGFVIDGNTNLVGGNPETFIGIVDPYLDQVIREGDAFWMMLYPQSITSLRHNWSHPAFGASQEPDDMTRAEHRLREAADDMGLSYRDVMHASKRWLETGETWVQYGGESAQDYMYDNEKRKQFWADYEIVMGGKLPSDFDIEDAQPYSCSC